MLTSTDSQVNSNFLMHYIKTHMFDIFTPVLMTHTHVFQILTSLLTCTHTGIPNMLQVLTTLYLNKWHKYIQRPKIIQVI